MGDFGFNRPSNNNGENSGTGDGTNVDLSSYAKKNNPKFNGSVSMGRNADSNVGVNSTAMGDNVEASGESSHAEGSETVASADYSHAEGWYSEATGAYSHAEGSSLASGEGSHSEGSGKAHGFYAHAEGVDTSSFGDGSHAEGWYPIAMGKGSHAEGVSSYAYNNVGITTKSSNEDILTAWNKKEFSLAKGEASHVEGINGLALGDYSHVEGEGNIASGTYSHAEGNSTEASGADSHAEGDNTIASGHASHAEGYYTTANGEGSHAEGLYTMASNFYSHAEGYNTEASGYASHAEGLYTMASGDYSHAEGDSVIASAYSSHAEGQSTTASADCSHAEGESSIASGESSHAEGRYTIASSKYQHVQGKYNIEDITDTYAHIVGNGLSEDARSNAHTLDWDGNAWFAGNVTIGADNKELATKEYVDDNSNQYLPIHAEDTGYIAVYIDDLTPKIVYKVHPKYKDKKYLYIMKEMSDDRTQDFRILLDNTGFQTEYMLYSLSNTNCLFVTHSMTGSYSYSGIFGATLEECSVVKKPYYLNSSNTTEYTPTADYHPATKKYVDDNNFSGDYNDLDNKPVSIINFNTDFVDAVATYSEAYKVDAIAFNQSITVDDSCEYFVEAKYTNGTVVTKPLELAETNYNIYSRINAKAVVGSFDGNVIDTNNQIGFVTSLIPIKYYNNNIKICKRHNTSWYDFNLLVVDENLTITNIYTHDNLPTVDSLPSTTAYFAIYKYYTSSITDVDNLFSGDATDGGLYIKIKSDIKYAGVCIFLEHSEEGNSILSNTEYTICEATSNYVLRNSDFGLYIADSMDVIYPASYSETFVANDTGFASAMLIMNYSNISSIRVYTKNILVNEENKELATKEYVDEAVASVSASAVNAVSMDYVEGLLARIEALEKTIADLTNNNE